MSHLHEIYQQITKQQPSLVQDGKPIVTQIERLVECYIRLTKHDGIPHQQLELERKIGQTIILHQQLELERKIGQTIIFLLDRLMENPEIPQLSSTEEDGRYQPKEELTPEDELNLLLQNTQHKVENAPRRPQDRRKEILMDACGDLSESVFTGRLHATRAREMLLQSCYHTEEEKKGVGKFTPGDARAIVDAWTDEIAEAIQRAEDVYAQS